MVFAINEDMGEVPSIHSAALIQIYFMNNFQNASVNFKNKRNEIQHTHT